MTWSRPSSRCFQVLFKVQRGGPDCQPPSSFVLVGRLYSLVDVCVGGHRLLWFGSEEGELSGIAKVRFRFPAPVKSVDAARSLGRNVEIGRVKETRDGSLGGQGEFRRGRGK